MVQNIILENKRCTGTTKTKKILILNDVSSLFVLLAVRLLLSSIEDRLGFQTEKTADISWRHHWFPCKKTFKEKPQATHQYPELGSVSNWFKQISHASWPVVSEWCDVIGMEFQYVVYQSRLNYQPLFAKWAHAPPLNRQRNAWVCYCQLPPIK